MAEKAVCPVCLKLTRIRVDGTLNRHGHSYNTQERADHKPKKCPGSGKAPEATHSTCTLA